MADNVLDYPSDPTRRVDVTRRHLDPCCQFREPIAAPRALGSIGRNGVSPSMIPVSRAAASSAPQSAQRLARRAVADGDHERGAPGIAAAAAAAPATPVTGQEATVIIEAGIADDVSGRASGHLPAGGQDGDRDGQVARFTGIHGGRAGHDIDLAVRPGQAAAGNHGADAVAVSWPGLGDGQRGHPLPTSGRAGQGRPCGGMPSGSRSWQWNSRRTGRQVRDLRPFPQ